MSKYVWDVESLIKDSGPSKDTGSYWYELTINDSGNYVVSNTSTKNFKLADPRYLYVKSRTAFTEVYYFVKPSSNPNSPGLGYATNITGLKKLKDYIKKLFPKIEINGQVIGGLKLKDNSGVIKEVSNIRYKDNSGIVKNLK